MKRITIVSAFAIALLGGVSASFGASAAAPQYIEIPAGELREALIQLSKRYGVDLFYRPEQVKGLKTNGVKGELTTEEAVRRLIEGTSLKVSTDASGAMVIQGVRDEGKPVTSGLDPADQMRVAEVSDAGAEDKPRNEDGKSKDGQQITVEGKRDRAKPFVDGNADIPRTIDDAQPYYIFNSETIAQSGAVNIEDFLKQRLTMNTVARTNGQTSGDNVYGNTSSINLRGLGADKTLILVNGRRMAGLRPRIASMDAQPDLNGIPISAIDRIEVLPSSASGIYGGSAIGGVVNVILKKDHVGGDLQVSYDNTWDMASSRRSVSGSYALALEGGKTNLSASAAWSESEPMLLRDRVSIFAKNLADIQSRVPTFVYSSINPWLGALPNIAPTSPAVMTLTLKNNGAPLALNSRSTHVPSGISSAVSMEDLSAGLLANAGQWNMDFPRSTQGPTGLLRPFGVAPETKSLRIGARRQMLRRVELFADLSFTDNSSVSIFNPFSSAFTIPAAAPTNPFATAVRVQAPIAAQVPVQVRSQSRNATLGALIQLPWAWNGELDYSWSESRSNYTGSTMTDYLAVNADLLSGALNPLVDTLAYPLDLQRYLVSSSYRGSNRLHDLALRGSGPLPSLPWGAPNMTVGLERRITRTPMLTHRTEYPVSTLDDNLQILYARESTVDSGYVEMSVPLIKAAWLPWAYALDLQLSGRGDRYTIDAGTSGETHWYNRTPLQIDYTGVTLDGEPYLARAGYSSRNYTVGLKFQPVRHLTARISRATAFLPPSPTELLSNPPRVAQFYEQIVDPVTDETLPGGYEIITGGNPDLVPQNSRSLNAGIIWEPEGRLSGLRLNAEYYRIDQFDAISGFSPQQIVDQESTYPGRVTRDGNGRIIAVNATSINLYRRQTEGWDLSLDYSMDTERGRFSLHGMGSTILRLREQYSQTQPDFELVTFANEGGAAKYKANVALIWEREAWTAGWAARYFGSYKQIGAAGGPLSLQYSNGAQDNFYISRQGADTIPPQIYHDLHIGYTFGKDAVSGPLRGLAVQVSVRNVFNKVPPLDIIRTDNYYVSGYGDMRLRSWSLSLQRVF